MKKKKKILTRSLNRDAFSPRWFIDYELFLDEGLLHAHLSIIIYLLLFVDCSYPSSESMHLRLELKTFPPFLHSLNSFVLKSFEHLVSYVRSQQTSWRSNRAAPDMR